MANIKFTNFAYSQLAVGIGPSDGSLTVTAGHGARFPTLTTGEYFYCTIENAAGQREIVKVTARSTDAFTIVRAQDNTTSQAWVAGDSVALRLNAAAITDTFDSSVKKTALTGSAIIPVGTTAQRDGTPAAGYIRFNSTISQFEGYNGSAWSSVGGGATGGGSDQVFVENGQTVTANYTLTANKNAMSTGPITVNSGISVTVPSGARWVII